MDRYPFLLLSILFLIPGGVIFLLRKDLRPMLGWMSLMSLPFGMTEFLFYPEYWEPATLFNLVEIIGFSIEDLLFVVGLSAICSGSYALVFRRQLTALKPHTPTPIRSVVARTLWLILPVAGAVALAAILGIPMIFAAPIIMLAAALYIMVRRWDLIVPGLISGALVTAIYMLLSLIYSALLPGVFTEVWHSDLFTGLFFLGIPLEEYLYGASSGFVGSIVYPYISATTFKRITRIL